MLDNVADVLTVREAAVVLRCGLTKMLHLIYEGYIKARLVCGKYIILKEDLIEFIERC